MIGYSYAPARTHDWLAVATAGRLLVAKVDGNSDRLAELAATGGAGTSVQQVLEVLTARGLGATGPFALLFWVDGEFDSKGLGVIVRGEAAVTVDTADGEVSVSSRGVTTWSEQVIERPTGFRVDVDLSAPAGAPSLPLQDGAVWATRVIFTGSDATAAPGRSRSTSAAATPAVPAGAVPAEAPPHEAETPRAAESAPVHEETRVFHTTGRAADATEGDAPAAEADGYDYLFGATVFRPVGAAAVEQPSDDDASALPEPGFLTSPKAGSSAGPAPSPAAPPLGDHDGRTMLATDVLAARRNSGTTATPALKAPLPPAHRYLLELPGGTSQALTAPVILGRAPSVSNVPASVLPHLVTLSGDDISRSHVRVAVEGDTVVVTDLHSSNGTHVVAPGKLPQLLRAGEPTPVITGTAIDLGNGIVLRVSEA